MGVFTDTGFVAGSDCCMLDQHELRSVLISLSQELGRPLVALRAGFELLLSETRPIECTARCAHLQTMIGLCDELLRLTRGCVDYAALGSGSRPLHYGQYTLAAIVHDIDHEFAPAAAARRLSWHCELEGTDTSLKTDASRCQEILGRLIANALRYTAAGGQVRVSVRQDGRSAWLVAIADTGSGVAASDLPRLFDPFFRVPREDRSMVDGCGLGLTICRELVYQLEGEIGLESELGKGTCVTARFPLEPAGSRQEPRAGPVPGRGHL